MQWYYPAKLGADLSEGFDKFDSHDDSTDEHLGSLLKAIIAHEEEEGKKIDAHIVTWRGMMTKVNLLYIAMCWDSRLIVSPDHVHSIRGQGWVCARLEFEAS